MASDFPRRTVLSMLGGMMLAPAALARPAVYPEAERELMVPAEGGRLYVRTNGAAKGEALPLLLIHGGPGGMHSTFLDALELSDERMVVLYDQLDSGRSDRPGDPANWTVERFAREIDAIRTALGIARWHVLGHSWGATVALDYAARQPSALAGLILASPFISGRSWRADVAARLGELPAAAQDDIRRCAGATPPPEAVCDAASEVFYAAFNHRDPIPQARRTYEAAHGLKLNEKLYTTMNGSSEFSTTGTLADYDGEPLLARLDGARTLFVIGQHDETRMETVAAFARRAGGAELAVIPGAAHGIFNDRPDETNAVLRGFLRRQDAGAAKAQR
ncbi:proline iminopeptidase-family hydrolase [Xanthobacter sp. KR7-65]|uniref:proline iminopeptidase-family hydrolase n=1 Tax=Xanthobacter sp. KR7-65 TaxID=3156612 RepID=UPI0032B6176A